ncbi:MAG: glycosyltransferase [Bacteroidales bacterium]|nr:glycosyltransferase [Candidatus Physcousia equi]
MKYSLIIPVYNRPDEVDELLDSLTQQTHQDFEVIVVEDGSQVSCESVCQKYATSLDLHYYAKANSGPGQSRNDGAERAHGAYLIVLDSDCVLPPSYMQAVEDELHRQPSDAFGGPDRAHESFTPVQKAINYSMTSFFTTGGIRGGTAKRKPGPSLDRFYPRSFNMGIRSALYQQLGGFSNMRFGEDIDFSYRICESGASCRLFSEAWVWHKRRTDMMKFWRQVHNSGIARINLTKRHPGTLKLVHLLPAVFTLGVFALLLLVLVGMVLWMAGSAAGPCLATLAFAPLVLFSLLVGVDSALRNQSLWVGLLSIRASFTQLMGYGTGFLRAWWLRSVCGRNEELQAYRENFYK